jgi:hypothetical protein
MNLTDIARMRMRNELLSRHPFKRPEQVVAHLGAMQAQDYNGALWAIAQRTPGATMQDVEHAIAQRRIVRSWPMRNTLHFMAGRDARWMLDLLTPRINASGGWATRRRFLGISDCDMTRASALVSRALTGGKIMTRAALYGVLDRGGVSPAKQRGLHILSKLAHELLICFGPHEGKQATFVLLDEWLPRGKALERDGGLKRIATTYFTSHGPATIRDFVWWSGLTVADARRGIAAAGKHIKAIELADETYYASPSVTTPKTTDTHLLPPFDEMLVAFRDRSASLNSAHTHHVSGTKNGLMKSTIVIDGQVVATWLRSTGSKQTTVTVKPFFALSASAKRAIADAGERYAHYLGMPVRVR